MKKKLAYLGTRQPKSIAELLAEHSFILHTDNETSGIDGRMYKSVNSLPILVGTPPSVGKSSAMFMDLILQQHKPEIIEAKVSKLNRGDGTIKLTRK